MRPLKRLTPLPTELKQPRPLGRDGMCREDTTNELSIDSHVAAEKLSGNPDSNNPVQFNATAVE